MSTCVFVGHAKPPANSVSGQLYHIISVVCEVDWTTGIVQAIEFTVATDVARGYLSRLIVGRNLNTDEDAIIGEIEKQYFSTSQKAIIQAFRDMTNKFKRDSASPSSASPLPPAEAAC
jgi:hypothetical protein